jgi:outer membrane receptor protein involved in Fe transport
VLFFGEYLLDTVLCFISVIISCTMPAHSIFMTYRRAIRSVSQQLQLAVSILCLSWPAITNAADQPEGPSQDAHTLPVIEVEGKKPESVDVQKTYSGVSTLSGQQIEDLKIDDMRSAFRLLPNINSSPSNNGNNGITIRGINSEGVGEPGQNSRSLASVVIDGASQSLEGIRRGARGLWDIEEIQVYRGPQISLQGRSGLAGAVILRSKDPTFQPEAALKKSFAHYYQQSEAYMVSGPLINDVLAIRVSGESMVDEHGIDYVDPSVEFIGRGRFHSNRLKLLFAPTALPGLTAKFTYVDTFDRPAVTAVAEPYRSRTYRITGQQGIETRRNNVRNQTLEIGYKATDTLRFLSTTSWITTRNVIDSVNKPFYNRDEDRTDEDFTQDLRLIFENQRLSLTTGLFVGKFHNKRDSLVNAELFLEDPIFCPTYPGCSLGTLTFSDLEEKRVIHHGAVFGELKYKLTDRWTIMGGIRNEFERDRTTTTYRSTYGSDCGNGRRCEGIKGTIYNRRTYTGHLPSLGVAYEFSPGHTLAFTATKGARAGFRDATSGTDVKPEELRHYELAYRGKWADGRLTTNINIYEYDWRDQQVAIPGSNQSASTFVYSVNAQQSTLKGAEFQIAAQPVPGLQLGGSFGVMKTRFDEFVIGSADYSGKEFPETPRRSASAWASYRHASGVFMSGDYSYKSGFFATSDLLNQVDKRVPGYGTTNLRLGYDAEHWTAVAFVNNLFDKEYLVGRDRNQGAYVGDPRLVGAMLTMRFY